MSRFTKKYLLGSGFFLAAVTILLAGLAALLGLPGAGGAWLVFGVGATVACSALLALWFTVTKLIRPLDTLTSALQRAAGGDFESGSQTNEAGDIGQLVSAFEFMRRQLRDTMFSRDYLDRLLSSMSETVLVTDPTGKILRVNTAANSLLGYGDGFLVGQSIDQVMERGLGESAGEPGRSTPRDGSFISSDGSPIPVSYTVSQLLDDHGEMEGTIYAAQNIAERKRVEQRIRYLARTDALTKLPNRMQFQHQLQQGIARARRARQFLALLYLDIDRFKDINDTFGHAVGDRSLETFAQRILAELPEGAAAGRLAGDEFAVMLSGFQSVDALVDELSVIAEALLATIGESFQVDGEDVFITTSIGIGIYPRDGDNVVDLIRNSDAALYHAKRAGGNCFEFHTSDMNTASVERLMLKSRLRRAIERDELRLRYQPKYSVKTGRIEGAEALIRWDLPDRGMVFPSDFIPLAEETNLILQLGDWVLDRVCRDYRLWQRVLPSPGRVSVNLSLKQLLQQRFLERVREIFRAHGVSPTCLELEITETTLMKDTNETIRILDELYGMGLHLAIDDFGTGYSSLSALQQFPISTLKIDQSFVQDVAVDKDDATIVATIIQMARNLKMEVIAEGVESEQQLEFLREHGCDYVQGHLFGDPTTAEGFRDLLVDQADGSGRYKRALG